MSSLDAIANAVECLRRGGVVLHATEGVWGFACDPWSDRGVDEILRLKDRSADKGFILIGAQSSFFGDQLSQLNDEHRKNVLDSWPGHDTWILPDVSYPGRVRGGRTTLACRVPAHAQARALSAAFGGAIVSSSANRSGKPVVVNADTARQMFAGDVAFILPGEVGEAGKASTIHGLDQTILR